MACREKKGEKMEYSSVPIIVICCYVLGEIYKAILKGKKKYYRYIPIVLSIFGGVLGLCIYFTNPEMIFDAENMWIALGIGMVSGVSATGANQIVKQLFCKDHGGNQDDPKV